MRWAPCRPPSVLCGGAPCSAPLENSAGVSTLTRFVDSCLRWQLRRLSTPSATASGGASARAPLEAFVRSVEGGISDARSLGANQAKGSDMQVLPPALVCWQISRWTLKKASSMLPSWSEVRATVSVW